MYDHANIYNNLKLNNNMLRFKNSILLQFIVYYILVVILLFAIPSLFLSEGTASDDMENLGLLEAVILYLFGAAAYLAD